MTTPFLILSDLHLTHSGSAAVADALAKLLVRTPGQEIVLAGDVFGLSSDPPSRDPVESVCSLLSEYQSLRGALRERLSQGAPLTLIAGNHDAALLSPAMRTRVLANLELDPEAPLRIVPWFLRRGAVHVEHGHLWDPDNAPAHPLSAWSPLSEPLGISLTRRFVAPRGVWQFAHAHETTLLDGLQRAFRLFGARAPLLVLQYFAASTAICGSTLFDRGLRKERALGEQALPTAARTSGVPEPVLRELIEAAPTPTHAEFLRTFLRLYYDRVLAALGVSSGALLAAVASPVGTALLLASGAYLALNVQRSGARYQNRPVRYLREGAEHVRRITAADLVVFGHTHVPTLESGYANAGSFGYPEQGQGRPFLRIDAQGTAELLRL